MTLLHTLQPSETVRTRTRKPSTPPPTLTDCQAMFHRMVKVGEFAAKVIAEPRIIDRSEAQELGRCCKQVARNGSVYRLALQNSAAVKFGFRYYGDWNGLDLLVGGGQQGVDREKKRHLRVQNASTARLMAWAQGKRTTV